LMQGHSETKQWKEAEKSDNTKGRMKGGEKRGVPFYKFVCGSSPLSSLALAR
jgi:hypothetical protein